MLNIGSVEVEAAVDIKETLDRTIDNDVEQNENAESNDFNGPEVMCYEDAAIKRKIFCAVILS